MPAHPEKKRTEKTSNHNSDAPKMRKGKTIRLDKSGPDKPSNRDRQYGKGKQIMMIHIEERFYTIIPLRFKIPIIRRFARWWLFRQVMKYGNMPRQKDVVEKDVSFI